mgnify:CR=1 FL=1
MSRRRRPEKREILPDPKYGDLVLSKFMNSVMLDGKKSTAEGIVYGALETVETRAKREPIGVFHDALNNIKPGIEVRSRRVGGATYQVPVEVRTERAQALAIRWLISAARARSVCPTVLLEERCSGDDEGWVWTGIRSPISCWALADRGTNSTSRINTMASVVTPRWCRDAAGKGGIRVGPGIMARGPRRSRKSARAGSWRGS